MTELDLKQRPAIAYLRKRFPRRARHAGRQGAAWRYIGDRGRGRVIVQCYALPTGADTWETQWRVTGWGLSMPLECWRDV